MKRTIYRCGALRQLLPAQLVDLRPGQWVGHVDVAVRALPRSASLPLLLHTQSLQLSRRHLLRKVRADGARTRGFSVCFTCLPRPRATCELREAAGAWRTRAEPDKAVSDMLADLLVGRREREDEGALGRKPTELSRARDRRSLGRCCEVVSESEPHLEFSPYETERESARRRVATQRARVVERGTAQWRQTRLLAVAKAHPDPRRTSRETKRGLPF